MPPLPPSITLGTLSQLAALTGVSFSADRAKTALQHFADDPDPLSRLVATAAEVGIAVAPIRQPLSDLLWLARSDSPVLIWSSPSSAWVTVTAAGWFKVRIADGDHPTARTTISRSELLQHLGAQFGNPLPMGVTVDENASKLVLSETGTSGTIVLKAAADAPASTTTLAVHANVSISFTIKRAYSSAPFILTVEK